MRGQRQIDLCPLAGLPARSVLTAGPGTDKMARPDRARLATRQAVTRRAAPRWSGISFETAEAHRRFDSQFPELRTVDISGMSAATVMAPEKTRPNKPLVVGPGFDSANGETKSASLSQGPPAPGMLGN